MTGWRRANGASGCERARQWISLAVDGELSELERATLARHLARCPGCREVETEVAALARLLRAAPPAAPARPLAVGRPRPRAVALLRRGGLVLAGAAAAAALAATLVVPGGGPPSSALGFRDAGDQARFALAHVRTEPQVFLVAPIPPFAERALG